MPAESEPIARISSVIRQTIQYVLTSYKVPAWKLDPDIQSRTPGCRELRRADNSQRLDPTPGIEGVVLKSMLVQNDVFELSDFAHLDLSD